jgi:hypothetical protein
MNLLIMSFSPSTCYFLSITSKYFQQHFVLKHPLLYNDTSTNQRITALSIFITNNTSNMGFKGMTSSSNISDEISLAAINDSVCQIL